MLTLSAVAGGNEIHIVQTVILKITAWRCKESFVNATILRTVLSSVSQVEIIFKGPTQMSHFQALK